MVEVRAITTVEEANAMHVALAANLDLSMMCNGRDPFPPPSLVGGAVQRQDLALYGAFDGDVPIAGAIVVTDGPRKGEVAWFYTAQGRAADAVAALTPVVVAAVGQPFGKVQNADVAAAFQRAFPANVSPDGTKLSWT